jgi:hypothetical protein
MKNIVLSCLLILLVLQTACLRIPPRCKNPTCYVAIDHNHAIGTETRANGDTKDVGKIYRGVPFFTYLFRKKYKAQEFKGYYRKINGIEAYDKRKSKSYTTYKKKKKKKKVTKPTETPAETPPASNEEKKE